MNLFGRPKAIDLADTPFEGVSGAYARADHRHGLSAALRALLATIGVTTTGSSVTNTTIVQTNPVENVYTATVTGATFTLPDVTVATVDVLTLTVNTALLFPAAVKGTHITLVLVQDATGSRTVTWDSTVVWAGNGTAPTLTTTAGKRDVLTFVCDDGATWLATPPGSVVEAVSTVATSGAAVTLVDVAVATVHYVTLTANCTFTFPAVAAGKSFTLILVQDGTGSRTATWPASVKWSGGTAPTLTTTAAKRDVFSFLCPEGSTYVGFTAGLNYS